MIREFLHIAGGKDSLVIGLLHTRKYSRRVEVRELFKY